MPDPTYTADQVATAARELRQAAGTDEERFPLSQVLSMLQDEVRLLRERGFTDDQIANLLSGFDIEVTPEQLTATPHPSPDPNVWDAFVRSAPRK